MFRPVGRLAELGRTAENNVKAHEKKNHRRKTDKGASGSWSRLIVLRENRDDRHKSNEE